MMIMRRTACCCLFILLLPLSSAAATTTTTALRGKSNEAHQKEKEQEQQDFTESQGGDKDDDVTKAFRTFSGIRAIGGYFAEAHRVPALQALWSPPPPPAAASDNDWASWMHTQATTVLASNDNRVIYPNPNVTSATTPDLCGWRTTSIGLDANAHGEMDFIHAMDYVPNTVVQLRNVHETEWASSLLRSTIDTAVGRPLVDADVYMAGNQAGSYGWHVDGVDNLAILVHGTKRFRIAGPTLGGETVVDVQLSAGQAVWIPSGHYHRGDGGTEGLSILFSVGFKTHQHDDKTIIDDESDTPFKAYMRQKQADMARLRQAPPATAWEYFSEAAQEGRASTLRELVSPSRTSGTSTAKVADELYLESLVFPPTEYKSWDRWIRSQAKTILNNNNNNKVQRLTRRLYAPKASALPHAFGWQVQSQQVTDRGDLLQGLESGHYGSAAATTILTGLQDLADVAPKMQALRDIFSETTPKTTTNIQRADLILTQPHAPTQGWMVETTAAAGQLVAVVDGGIHVRVAKRSVSLTDLVSDSGSSSSDYLDLSRTLQKGDTVFIPAGHYYLLQGSHGRSITWMITLESSSNPSTAVVGVQKRLDMDFFLDKQKQRILLLREQEEEQQQEALKSSARTNAEDEETDEF